MRVNQAEKTLMAVAEGTASVIGEDFFRSMVRHLAIAIQVKYIFVAECMTTEGSRIRSLAFWCDDHFADTIEYDVENTPCKQVTEENCSIYYASGIQDLFPMDEDLVNLGVNSYLGVPINDSSGTVIGHVVLLHPTPINNEPQMRTVLQIFASRAGAELERKQAEQDLENRTAQLLQKQKVLFELSKEEFPDQETAFNLIIKADAEQLKVKRVSVWLYNQERTGFICKALYHHGEIDNKPLVMKAEDTPRYFQTLERDGRISANDAMTDPATSEFSESYLKPLGIASMMDVPVLLRGKMLGIVCHEHIGLKRKWTVEDEDFANSISDLCALVLAESDRKQAEKALLRSEKRFRALYDHNPAMLFTVDEDGKVLSVNRFGI